ncbi:MAG: hypothetical protein WC935_00020 [Thermoleophilia bacterium]
MTAVPPPTLCPNTSKDIMYCPCQRCADHWRAWAKEAVKPTVEWILSDTSEDKNCTLAPEGIK